jgi:hypothetical protein
MPLGLHKSERTDDLRAPWKLLQLLNEPVDTVAGIPGQVVEDGSAVCPAQTMAERLIGV